jgi:hypothetical protein
MQRSQNISNDFFDEKYIGGYNETKMKIECFMIQKCKILFNLKFNIL